MSTATELLRRLLEICNAEDWDTDSNFDELLADIRAYLSVEPEADPVTWMFQHEDTGLIDYVDSQQVEWGFEKNNPRWQKIGPVYLHPPKPAEPEAEPVALKHRLLQIHDALESHLGDSDSWTEDMTDEEIREEDPVFWAAKEVASLIGDAPWDQYLNPPKPSPARKPMTEEEVGEEILRNADEWSRNFANGFVLGIRYAEKHHFGVGGDQ